MYRVGQPIVCIKSHEKGVTKEGHVYTVKGLNLCSCGTLMLDVGIKNTSQTLICSCGQVFTSDVWYQGAERFRPLDDLYNTEIEELMEEVNQTQPFELR